jgi:hypothetical protein
MEGVNMIKDVFFNRGSLIIVEPNKQSELPLTSLEDAWMFGIEAGWLRASRARKLEEDYIECAEAIEQMLINMGWEPSK